ncbi:hypothetical protein [Mesorhizobium sp. M0482]|uniref:hypothetical protein n=1 Tax=unclassified Mesorhizobium TaxID=325217 RepID=UPI00333CE910
MVVLESTYRAAADLADWDSAGLECDGFGPPAKRTRSARSRSRLRILMVGCGVDL